MRVFDGFSKWLLAAVFMKVVGNPWAINHKSAKFSVVKAEHGELFGRWSFSMQSLLSCISNNFRFGNATLATIVIT